MLGIHSIYHLFRIHRFFTGTGVDMYRSESMPRANVIRWLDGEGWIILSGGGDVDSAETGHIEASALAKVQPGEPLAYIWAAGDIEQADKHLEALYDLGAPTGYLVDILAEDDDT